jgi:hypothetical protein
MNDWGNAAVQAGGAFGVVVMVLAALGKGLAWLLNWHGERSDGRAAELKAWERSLVAREKEYRQTIEHQLGELKTEVKLLRGNVGALGVSLLEVTIELRVLDPASAALTKAAAVLRRAFPPDAALPEDMVELAGRLDGHAAEEGAR